MANNPNVGNFNLDKYLKQQMIEERRERIYQQVKLRSRVRKINRALASLKKAELYDESIAVENVFNLLESNTVNIKKTKAGYISLVSLDKKSITQQTAIYKALDQFVKNKTSSVKGMRELYEERRSELINMFDDKDFIKSLSYKDIKDIYSVFKSNEYRRTSSKYDSKTLFTLYTQSIDQQYDKEKFMKEISYYMDVGEDLDLKEDIMSLYDKYISKYTTR